MNINNKGFTLVELLAVMVILISISLVAVGAISSSLVRREEKELEEQKELAIGAAKIYFSLENTDCVNIQKLEEEDYFSDGKKIDVLKEEGYLSVRLDNNSYICSKNECE